MCACAHVHSESSLNQQNKGDQAREKASKKTREKEWNKERRDWQHSKSDTGQMSSADTETEE